ncbi:hypothetical protein F4680DRAFT_468615 [Xylaria scruposa]|nr:hypothetical protein F4680DRAFT_468615 [Xylaria scruposa]
MSNRSVSEFYCKSMRHHRFGYALYEPAPCLHLYPGVVGYLDENQHWNPILDLNDTAKVKAEGYTPLGYLQRAVPDTCRCGPLVADEVLANEVALGVGADASSFGFPLDTDGAVSYTTARGFGAVLVCDGDVISEGFDYRDSFRVWLQLNASLLFSRYPDTKKHGVCVATWTYWTKNIHISAWEGGANSATVGYTGAGRERHERTWHCGHANTGWSTYTDQKRVIFFAGVKIYLVTKEMEEIFRGDRFTFGEESEGEYSLVEIVNFGEDWHIISDS